jgi:anti-sigma B factor antagonist
MVSIRSIQASRAREAGSVRVLARGQRENLKLSPGRIADMPDQAPPVAVVQEKDIRIVEFTNNKILDEANIAEIGNTLNALIDEMSSPKLLLDFNTVDHLSSAALGMLINANNRIKQKNGKFRLANIKPQILEVFRITKLDKLFRIFPTRQDAVKSFSE